MLEVVGLVHFGYKAHLELEIGSFSPTQPTPERKALWQKNARAKFGWCPMDKLKVWRCVTRTHQTHPSNEKEWRVGGHVMKRCVVVLIESAEKIAHIIWWSLELMSTNEKFEHFFALFGTQATFNIDRLFRQVKRLQSYGCGECGYYPFAKSKARSFRKLAPLKSTLDQHMVPKISKKWYIYTYKYL